MEVATGLLMVSQSKGRPGTANLGKCFSASSVPQHVLTLLSRVPPFAFLGFINSMPQQAKQDLTLVGIASPAHQSDWCDEEQTHKDVLMTNVEASRTYAS